MRSRQWRWNFSGCILPLLVLFTGLGCCRVSVGQTADMRDTFPALSQQDWQTLATAARLSTEMSKILRINHRLGDTSETTWDRSLKQPLNDQLLEQFASDPTASAGMACHGLVRVQSLAKMTPSDALQQAFDIPRLYLLRCRLEAAPQSQFDLITGRVPEIWKSQAKDLDQPIQFRGVVINVKPDGQPVVVANNIAWFPEEQNASLKVEQGRLLLAKHGFDLGLLDTIVQRSPVAFTSTEQPLFNQLVQAIQRIDDDTQQDHSHAPLDLLQCLKRPNDHAGHLYSIEGSLRRVSSVQVTSPILKDAIGADVYYQLDIFLPVGDRSFVLRDSQGELTISGSFGITVLVLKLPKDLADPKSSIGAKVKLDGVFAKTWTHKTSGTREVSNELRRPNPIVFGLASSLQVIEPADSETGDLFGWFWILLVGLLSMLGFWHWRQSKRTRSATTITPDAVDFSGLD